jgi:hypothetical protein
MEISLPKQLLVLVNLPKTSIFASPEDCSTKALLPLVGLLQLIFVTDLMQDLLTHCPLDMTLCSSTQVATTQR